MRARTTRQRHGDVGEAIAAGHLVELGWRVLGRQVVLGRIEVDLVALDPGPPPRLVVVEVRTRTTDRFGPPEASIDAAKVARCYAAASALRRAGVLPDGTRLPRCAWRVDVIAVELDGETRIRHLRGVLPP